MHAPILPVVPKTKMSHLLTQNLAIWWLLQLVVPLRALEENRKDDDLGSELA
jgi:hypothetical protein